MKKKQKEIEKNDGAKQLITSLLMLIGAGMLGVIFIVAIFSYAL